MDANQNQRLLDFLRAKGFTGCTICGGKTLLTGPDVVTGISVDSAGNTIIGGGTHPMVLLICDGCGHVMHFQAAKVGLKP